MLVLELIAADFHPVSCFLSCTVRIFDVIQFCCHKGIFTRNFVGILDMEVLSFLEERVSHTILV